MAVPYSVHPFEYFSSKGVDFVFDMRGVENIRIMINLEPQELVMSGTCMQSKVNQVISIPYGLDPFSATTRNDKDIVHVTFKSISEKSYQV